MSPVEPIAVIGIGCRFPGSSSTPSRFWDLLSKPRDVGSRVPRERYDGDAFYHPDSSHHGTSNARESYFLSEDVTEFDASFFNISAKEAESIDPQQRLLLETVYEGIEAAGLRMDDLKGSKTGVFCGVMCDDYQTIQMRDVDAIPHYTATGTARSIISNRVSYFFDWHGPSMTIDTACSSSLVAVHLAAKALQDGDCRVAIASGTNLILAPNMYVSESKLNMLSSRGRSRMWDAGADGYARGEGVASVVVKRLSDAIADNDTIDCVIRATNINQDGRSMGITMPSSAAQTSLIQSTYRKAGLDLVNRPEDRCQYFEAHGTGTPAGDPQEASAIHAAFFSESSAHGSDDVLHVGSAKTVVGHTEGTAGLAALIKGVMSLQHGVIAPNLHFESLNPAIEPHYQHLRVPTETQEWPKLPPGVPRRVSVNSFGFGGTNAHAIIESYNPLSSNTSNPVDWDGTIPFVFSAPSEKSMGNVLASYVEYLDSSPSIDLADLAWTLFRRRTTFSHRVAFFATSIEGLQKRLREETTRRASNQSTTVISKPYAGRPKILGVFTGQGAQWPQMGLDLISRSPDAIKWLETLQASLNQLPIEYRPDYTLLGELTASPENSRLHLAEIAQPLCTAVQIILVKFLRSLGVEFSAVVGHSSGEIAAAYTTGFLSDTEAIQVAHLRGQMAPYAGNNGQKGAMMAIGMSPTDAEEICQNSIYAGRVKMAAVNSSSSVTLSGDADAIIALEAQLKEQDTFARLLKVNMAYHSHHMLPCSEPYLRALEICEINPRPLSSQVKWFSSVYHGKLMDASRSDAVRGSYWCDNMVNTVLFTQAVTEALKDSSYAMILEVGPHPALKAPVLNALSEVSKEGAPTPAYTSMLNRSKPSSESSATAIGDIYSYLGADCVDIESYAQIFSKKDAFSLVKGLPCYPFDRTNSYWAESRISRACFRESGSPNQLLGSLSPDTTDAEYRWRNFLRQSEISWLGDHCIQSQVVFPATGYVAMALEAAYRIAGDRQLQLFDVQDLVIKSAIAISENDLGVETLFVVNQLSETNNHQLSAAFGCYSTMAGKFQLRASGRMSITFGEEIPKLLPQFQPQLQGMSDIDTESFYDHLGSLGYGYTGLFSGISSLMWKKNMSVGRLKNASELDPLSPLAMHPALMDLLLQGMLAAVGKPGNEQLYTLHIPVSLGRVLINPAFCSRIAHLGSELPFEAALTYLSREVAIGDAALFDTAGNGIVSIENVKITPLMKPTAADDKQLFFGVQWGRLLPDLSTSPMYMTTRGEADRCEAAEKIALAYMVQVDANLTADDRTNLDWHGSRVVAWIDHVLSLTRQGKHPVCQREWLATSLENDWQELTKTGSSLEVSIMRVVGENLLPFLRGETTILEALRESKLLEVIYTETQELAHFNQRVADVVEQLAMRFPHMKILEIGAGSGSATKAVVNRLGDSFHSYTFTDISAGFFEEAQKTFQEHSDRFAYRLLDIEKEPQQQGFELGSHDLVIAANVLHATRDLRQTLSNARALLKPGGQLVLLESANPDLLRLSFSMAGFEGWWLGENDGRPLGAMITPTGWHHLLQETGFSGIDTVTGDQGDGDLTGFSVFASQAVNDHITLLRDPLGTGPLSRSSNDLVIVGGASLATSKLVGALQSLLRPFFRQTICVNSLGEPLDESLGMITLLNVSDLDCPFFQALNPQSLQTMQDLVNATQNLLWVTAGNDADKPYQSMSQSLLRCLSYENPHARFQHLNIVEGQRAVDARVIADSLLRVVLPEFDNDYRLPHATWTIEPELRLVEGGVMEIPRITPDPGMNGRLMSKRRLVYDEVDMHDSNVVFTVRDGAYEPLSSKIPTTAGDNCQSVVRVTASTLTALRVPGSGFLHLVIGQDMATEDLVLAFSIDNAAVISTPSSWVVPYRRSDVEACGFLAGLASTLWAMDLVNRATPMSSLVVHEADKSLRTAIKAEASQRQVVPCFTTTREEVALSDPEVHLVHPLDPTRRLSQSVPESISLVASFDKSTDQFFTRLPAMAQGKASLERIEDFQRAVSAKPTSGEIDTVADILQRAVAVCSGFSGKSGEDVNVIGLHLLAERQVDVTKLQILDWQSTSPARVSLQPATSEVSLSANKTYLLIGMTGDLGMSVCEWMASKGARNVVLASRRPQTDESWIDSMAKAGTRIETVAMDVTSKESIMQADQHIGDTFPPLGGIVNGAMILLDQMFSAMPFDVMNKVLKPKVLGSLLLDEIYSTIDLEFFICFGSLTGPAGNRGQSAYSAATAFMTSLIEGRRKRGQVGSIINPGEIRGVGYVARTSQDLVQTLRNAMGDTSVSEGELNELFAEAILAGHPSSGREAAPIAGFPVVDPEQQPDIIWLSSPRAWRQIRYSRGTSSEAAVGEAVSVKQQLASVKSEYEARDVIEQALISKICVKLQLPEDAEVTEDHSLMELGVDSLVAVDLRTWFVKELGVDMPVIKLLNSSSISELIDHAMTKLPEELIGGLSASDEPRKAPGQGEQPARPARPEPSMDRKDSQGSIESTNTSSPSEIFTPVNEGATDSEPPTPTENKSLSALSRFERIEKLSYAQSRFWFLQQLRPNKTWSNISLLFKLDGMPDVNQLSMAVEHLGRRHQMLRTCYLSGNEGPYQAVLATPILQLEVVRVNSEVEARDIYHSLQNHVYDLENGDNFRMCLAVGPDKKPWVVIGFHHICLDGVSFNMLLGELERAYLNQPLPPITQHYADYSVAQRAAYESGKMAKDVAYWRKEFGTFPESIPLLPMSKVQVREVLLDHPREDVRVELPALVMNKVKAVSKRLRMTPFNFFLTILRVFIGRLTQSKDFCIGISDVHRVEEGDYSLIGLLLNLLPVRFTGGLENCSFRDVLMQTQTRARGAIAHSRVQFDRLLDEMAVPRSATHSPLFQVMLDWQPQNTEKRRFGDLQGHVQEWTINKTAFDMILSIMDSGDGAMVLNFHLQQALFTKEAADLVARSYVTLVESFASADLDQLVTELPLYPRSDLSQAVELGKGPMMIPSQWPSTVSKRIAEISRRFPDRVAVKEAGSDQGFTYRALQNRVNVIAASLTDIDVKPGSRVCILQHPTTDWISCMLAIWRLGAVYVPLDMQSPVSRLSMMVEGCNPQVIICHDESKTALGRMNFADVCTLNISALDMNKEHNVEATEDKSSPGAGSVILYSSGTTGVPKSYQLSHGGLLNQIEGFTLQRNLDAPTTLQHGPLTFDITLEQILTSLTTGGRVVMAPREVRGHPTALAKIIASERITCTMATPSEYLMWIQYASGILKAANNWTTALSGGEPLSGSLVDAFRTLQIPNLRLVNFYGPGETTVASHQIEIDYQNDNLESSVIPVGHSLPNYTTCIVDQSMKPVPQGISGEIVIGGAGLCLGYLHLDHLNQTSFVPDSFATEQHVAQGWTRAYRTFDRGYLRPDGALVLEGRLEGDTQIKLRGMRMDMVDIENEIIRTAETGVLSRVVVSPREDINGDTFLAAHAEFQPDFDGDKEDFLRQLRKALSLPQYMRPSIIVPIEQMPITIHGKLDRREIGSLPLPTRKRSSLAVDPTLGLSDWIQTMGTLWGEILDGTVTDLENLSQDTDFFLAGGSSILLVKLQVLLTERAGAKIPLIELLERSTLVEMADTALSYRARSSEARESQMDKGMSGGDGVEAN